MLDAFLGLIGQAVRSEISVKQLEKSAGELDPVLGSAIAQVANRSKSVALALVILALFLSKCSFETKFDLNRLFDQVRTDRPSVTSVTGYETQKQQPPSKAAATSNSADIKHPPIDKK